MCIQNQDELDHHLTFRLVIGMARPQAESISPTLRMGQQLPWQMLGESRDPVVHEWMRSPSDLYYEWYSDSSD